LKKKKGKIGNGGNRISVWKQPIQGFLGKRTRKKNGKHKK